MTNAAQPLRAKNHSKALVVVAKRPAQGQTKTRLTPPLSLEKASTLYECFLQDTLYLMRQVPDVQPVLAFLPITDKNYFYQIAPEFDLVPQSGDSLGARLDNITTLYLQQGYTSVVVMDSDSPTLPVEYLLEAFENLVGEADVVIGPCDDGGYYLIGLKQPAPRLLREVRMSTPRVTTDTLELAAKEGLRVHLLPAWYDVDDASSLARLQAELAHLPASVAAYTRRFLLEG